ncbi:MAG: arabinogalactan endo-1,4-beta-galactosidase [Bacteroidales bacterium]|nr:arabinogalactan endo-1,4-beta-galactosidase [Bacteroidales bacterium]
MKRIRNWAAAALLLMGVFMPPAATSTAKQPANGYPDFAIGCDVSWYNRVEDNGDLTFYKSSTKTTANKTTQKDILYDRGIDAIRLRVWVNPDNSLAKSGFTATLASSQTFVATGGYCDTEDVIAIAKELSANGHRFMIDFHMSDTWADPSKQLVPSAWTSCTSASAVATKIKEHVTEVLTECYNNDINVAWVQIGNETNTGMLLYTPPSASGGTASSFAYAGSIGSSSGACNNFTTYFKAGYDAAKAIYPNCKVIFQHGAGCTSSTVTWCMNCLTSSSSNPNKANFTPDLIGISVYPAPFTTDKGYTSSAWSSYAAEAVTNIENLYINYGYYSMICEFGMPNDWAYETSYSYSTHKEWITHCNTYVKACTQYLLSNSSVQKYCQGMFYWEPLADHYDDYVQAGVYDVDGYNGSDSWARTNVTPNAWWDAVADYTNFPDGD